MTGTTYTVRTISQHTGLSLKYLQNPDSPLKKVINTFPEISPDGVGLNDIGLLTFDEYIRCCSNRNGKPLMKFKEWKKLMSDEYGLNESNENTESTPTATDITQLTVQSATELDYEPIQPIRIGNLMGGFKEKINAMGDELAQETSTVLDSNIAKIEAVIISRAERLNAALNSFNK